MRVLLGKKSALVDVTHVSLLESIRGLMFTRSLHIPLFFPLRFPLSIHSLFVFYPFLAVWISEQRSVLRVDTVFPFTLHISPPDGAKGLLEIPIHVKNTKIGSFLVGKRTFSKLLSS